MYIYHFWPLCMHCKKDDYDWCFLETFTTFSGFRETWIWKNCFDAHFRKFRDFWWFWSFLIGKWTFWTLFEDPLTFPLQKSRYICLLTPWTLSKPKTPKPYFDHFGPLWGSGERLRILDPIKWHFSIWCEMVRNGVNMSKTSSQPFKVALCKLRYKTTILHFWHPVLDPYFLTSWTKCWFVVP